MTAGELIFRRTVRATGRVNWRRITDRIVTGVALSFAVFVILYAWMGP